MISKDEYALRKVGLRGPYPYAPADIRLRYLHKSLTAESLLALCSTSREYAQLCRDKNVWIDIIQRELQPKPESLEMALNLFPDLSGKDLYTLMELRTYAVSTFPHEEEILRKLLMGPPIRTIRQLVPLKDIVFPYVYPRYRFRLSNGMTLMFATAHVRLDRIDVLAQIIGADKSISIVLQIPNSLIRTVMPMLISSVSQIDELPLELLDRYQTVADALRPIRNFLNLPDADPSIVANIAFGNFKTKGVELKIEVQA